MFALAGDFKAGLELPVQVDLNPYSQNEALVAGNPGPKILLTDTNRWALAARLAIDLAKAGASVSAVCPTRGHPLLKTRALRANLRVRRRSSPRVIAGCD